MPRVGFTIPVLEREKAVHAVDRAATVIDQAPILPFQNSRIYQRKGYVNSV
jgi:hypothetical protein